MDRVAFGLMTLAMQWLYPRYNARMQFMEMQIRMLRSRVDASRIVPTPRERTELIRLGSSFEHEIDDIMHVVLPETYKKWLRELRDNRKHRPAGRPRTPLATRNLVLRLARENLRWGYRRIVGEIKKLGIKIGVTTIREILKQEGHFPDPNKATKMPPIPWTTFVHANLDSMVATDFFTKRIMTLRGIRDAYVLVFIHLGTRKVYSSAATYHPDKKWVMQQARNAAMWMDDDGFETRYLIRDRDKKFPPEFDPFWKDEGIRVIKTPVKAPKANAFCESFIGSTKRETLNHFVCFSLEQLDYINREWLTHYHEHRPHRGVGRDNTVLDEDFVPEDEGEVRSRTRLGGLLREYYREAA